MMAKYHDEKKQKQTQDKRSRDVKNKDKPPVPREGRRTARPIKEDKGACTFRFRVYWDETKKDGFCLTNNQETFITVVISMKIQHFFGSIQGLLQRKR